MPHRDLSHRLQALEAMQTIVSMSGDGYAPDAWTRLAPWALLVHDVGGWDAAIAAQNAGTLPTENNPYARGSGGPLWDVVTYWQRGDTRRMPNRMQEQTALWVVAECVHQLLYQGVSRAEIATWSTGRLIWDEVYQACHEMKP